MPEQIEKEVKKQVLERVPPGDRWKSVIENNGKVYPSLTDGLEYSFQATGAKEFHLSSFEGKVFIVKKEVEEIPDEPPKTYSLYGEEY